MLLRRTNLIIQTLTIFGLLTPISFRGLWLDYIFILVSILLGVFFIHKELKTDRRLWVVFSMFSVLLINLVVFSYELSTKRYEYELVKKTALNDTAFGKRHKEAYFKYRSLGCGNGLYWENIVYEILPIVEFSLKYDDCSHFIKE